MNIKLLFSILIGLLFKLCAYGFPTSEELYDNPLVPNRHLTEGSYCKSEIGKVGICRKLPDCPSKLQEVKEGRRDWNSPRCGFQNFTEIVCCPFNITDKIGLRPAEIACRQYENDEATGKQKNSEIQYHIFSGTQARRGEFPYMVALGYNVSDTIEYNCGGTLISSQYVLTAAHCVNNVQDQVPVEIRIGDEDLNSISGDEQRIPIIKVITHPRFRRSVNYNDMAILKLSIPVSMTNKVRPICIQTKALTNMDMSSNISLIVIGWGATSFDNERSAQLMKTSDLSLVDRESCAESFNGYRKLPDGLDENFLCVLDTNTTRRSDACQGDSGGPLLIVGGPNHSIVGITAFGQSCGGLVPGVYTAIYSYLEWIERTVWPEMIED